MTKDKAVISAKWWANKTGNNQMIYRTLGGWMTHGTTPLVVDKIAKIYEVEIVTPDVPPEIDFQI